MEKLFIGLEVRIKKNWNFIRKWSENDAGADANDSDDLSIGTWR